MSETPKPIEQTTPTIAMVKKQCKLVLEKFDESKIDGTTNLEQVSSDIVKNNLQLSVDGKISASGRALAEEIIDSANISEDFVNLVFATGSKKITDEIEVTPDRLTEIRRAFITKLIQKNTSSQNSEFTVSDEDTKALTLSIRARLMRKRSAEIAEKYEQIYHKKLEGFVRPRKIKASIERLRKSEKYVPPSFVEDAEELSKKIPKDSPLSKLITNLAKKAARTGLIITTIFGAAVGSDYISGHSLSSGLLSAIQALGHSIESYTQVASAVLVEPTSTNSAETQDITSTAVSATQTSTETADTPPHPPTQTEDKTEPPIGLESTTSPTSTETNTNTPEALQPTTEPSQTPTPTPTEESTQLAAEANTEQQDSREQLPFFTPINQHIDREITSQGEAEALFINTVSAENATNIIPNEPLIFLTDPNTRSAYIEVNATNEITTHGLINALNSNLSHPAPESTFNPYNPFSNHNPDFYGAWFGGNHTGSDYSGTVPIYNIFESEVVAIGLGFNDNPDQGLGPNTIVMRSVNPVGKDGNNQDIFAYSIYGHNSSISENIQINQIIDPGMQIGTSGETGSAEGEHLHLEIALGTYFAIDPELDNGDVIFWEEPITYIDPHQIFNSRLASIQDGQVHTRQTELRFYTYPELPDLHFENTGIHSNPELYGTGSVEVNYEPFLYGGVERYVITTNINDGYSTLWHLDGQGGAEDIFNTYGLIGKRLATNPILTQEYESSIFSSDGSRYDGVTGTFFNSNGVPRTTLTPTIIGRINDFSRVFNFANANDNTNIAILSVLREDGTFSEEISQYTIHQIPPVDRFAYRERELTTSISLGRAPTRINFSLGCINFRSEDYFQFIDYVSDPMANGVEVNVIFSYPHLNQSLLTLPPETHINEDPFLDNSIRLQGSGTNSWYMVAENEGNNRQDFYTWSYTPEAYDLIPNLNNEGRRVISRYLSEFESIGWAEFDEAVNFWTTVFPDGTDTRDSSTATRDLQQTTYTVLSSDDLRLRDIELPQEDVNTAMND